MTWNMLTSVIFLSMMLLPAALASCVEFDCPANMTCVIDPVAGRACICIAGFEASKSGMACVKVSGHELPISQNSTSVSTDPCTNIICPLRRTTGLCVDGECVCKAGFQKNIFGTCVLAVSCDRIICATNMVCQTHPNHGTFCECLDGHVKLKNGLRGCEKTTTVCSTENCPSSIGVCGEGKCICNTGYRRNAFGRCVPQLSCRSKDFLCPRNSRCASGRCVCNAGFRLKRTLCIPITGDVDMSTCASGCGQNQRWEKGKCKCLTGYVMVPEGIACELEIGIWAEWSPWKPCSTTCNKGAQLRFRECQGRECVGSPVETQSCNDVEC